MSDKNSRTTAGRVELIGILVNGLPVLDENDEPTGEYSEPLITVEEAIKLLNNSDIFDKKLDK